jgi:hypothetical protein
MDWFDGGYYNSLEDNWEYDMQLQEENERTLEEERILKEAV